MKRATVLNTSSRALLDACRKLGLDTDAMIAAAGVDPSVLSDADGRIAGASVGALWREAYERSGDPHLSLHAVEALPAGAYKVIDFLAASSSTVGAGLERISRYFPLINNAVQLPITLGPENALLRVINPGDPTGVSRPYAEYTLAAVYLRSCHAYRERYPLIRVDLAYPCPGGLAEYERVFGAPVCFGTEHTQLCIQRRVWDRPVADGNEGLAAVLEQHAQTLLAAVPTDAGLARRVRLAIHGELRGGDPMLPHVAKRLGMAGRTVQRKLKEEGTSYADLLNETRSSVAQVYLKERDLSLAEVGHLLGFSEQSSFSRAFKRWTGSTPRQYRISAA